MKLLKVIDLSTENIMGEFIKEEMDNIENRIIARGEYYVKDTEGNLHIQAYRNDDESEVIDKKFIRDNTLNTLSNIKNIMIERINFKRVSKSTIELNSDNYIGKFKDGNTIITVIIDIGNVDTDE